MITYLEKGQGLHDAIRAAGHSIWQLDGVWKSSNDAAVQLIIDSYNVLGDQKAARIAAIKMDGLARISSVYPAINTLDELKLAADMWSGIISSSRNPGADLTKAINVYTAAKNAITAVNAATTKAQIDAVTVAWPA